MHCWDDNSSSSRVCMLYSIGGGVLSHGGTVLCYFKRFGGGANVVECGWRGESQSLMMQHQVDILGVEMVMLVVQKKTDFLRR